MISRAHPLGEKKEGDRTAVTGLVALMLVLWLGFVVHQSERFAGSLRGGLLGILGALLLLVPLAYSVVKRVPPLRRAVTTRVPMRTLLAVHVYAGILGPILGLLHSGHKFQSPLGIALTAMMLVAVLSGFVGRYLLSQISEEISEKQEMLKTLKDTYHVAARQLASMPIQTGQAEGPAGIVARLSRWMFVPERSVEAAPAIPRRLVQLTHSIADLEYGIKMHELFKGLFAKWLKVHLVISYSVYVLLALHVWSALRFGLRWLS
jgi:hypothetical protein